jgi:tRNA A22 N-methylase
MISKRLLEITKYITDNTTLIDVGCDHALLDIYVFLNKKNLKIIAVDINKNAIRKALKNAKKYDVLNKIDIKVNDGLKNLNLNVDTLIFQV